MLVQLFNFKNTSSFVYSWSIFWLCFSIFSLLLHCNTSISGKVVLKFPFLGPGKKTHGAKGHHNINRALKLLSMVQIQVAFVRSQIYVRFLHFEMTETYQLKNILWNINYMKFKWWCPYIKFIVKVIFHLHVFYVSFHKGRFE